MLDGRHAPSTSTFFRDEPIKKAPRVAYDRFEIKGTLAA
jgi:hypothetical protein